MRITIKHTINSEVKQRDLIVKIQYDFTKPLTATETEKDEYGRTVIKVWREKRTTVTVYEFDPVREPESKTVYVGTTVCDYHDVKKYSKKKGRIIAWHNALDELIDKNIISHGEYDVLFDLDLSATSYEIDFATKTVTKFM